MNEKRKDNDYPGWYSFPGMRESEAERARRAAPIPDPNWEIKRVAELTQELETGDTGKLEAWKKTNLRLYRKRLRDHK